MSRYLSFVLVAGLASVPLWLRDFYLLHVLITTGIFIIAAILTPTTDILNMCIFAAPMVALYILSIGIAYLVHPAQRRARRDKS